MRKVAAQLQHLLRRHLLELLGGDFELPVQLAVLRLHEAQAQDLRGDVLNPLALRRFALACGSAALSHAAVCCR